MVKNWHTWARLYEWNPECQVNAIMTDMAHTERLYYVWLFDPRSVNQIYGHPIPKHQVLLDHVGGKRNA